MKKTLIALFACSCLASAATLQLSDATYSSTKGETITFDTALSSVTVVTTLDYKALQDVMAKGAAIAKYTLIDLIDTDNNDIGLQTNYSSSDGIINTSGIYGTWNQGGAYDVGLASGSGFESSDFWTGAVSAAVSFTYSYGTGTTATFTLLGSDGSVLKELGGSFNTQLKGSSSVFDYVTFDNSIVTSAYVFDQVVTADEAKALSLEAAKTLSIPEPATASLSLLGLAALMIRRRR